MNIHDWCERLTAATAEIETVLSGTTDGNLLSPEQKAQVETLETECDDLTAKIKQHKEEQELRKRLVLRKALLNEPVGTSGSPSDPAASLAISGEKPSKIRVPWAGRTLKAFQGPTAELDAYRSGQFVLAALGHERARDWCRENGIQLLANAQNEGSNTYGGYLVPEEFERTIIVLRETYGVFRREAAQETMASDTKSVPRAIQGLTAYFVGENTEITQSDVKWDQILLVAKKAAVMARYSSELNEDAIVGMADTLASEAAYAMALKEDQAGFIGDGTATYGGIYGIVPKIYDAAGVTYAGSLYEAIAGNTAFSTLDLADFESMVGKLPQYAEAGAAWFISKAGFWASCARLIDAAGGNTGDMIAGRKPLAFLGYPVVISQVLNSTLTAQISTNLLLFGNMKLTSRMGNRRGITVKSSDQRYIEYDQIAIQVTERFAINNVVGDATAPTTAAGPMILLRTPGA